MAEDRLQGAVPLRRSAADRLRRVFDTNDDAPVALRELVQRLGGQGAPLALVALGAVGAVPSPGLPTGAVAGCLMVMLGIAMALGRRRLDLPAPLGRVTVGRATLRGLLDRVARLLAPIERRLAPRLRMLAGRPMRRIAGGVAVLLGLVLIAPLPGGNLVPGLAAVALGLGLSARDGGMVVVGLMLTAAGVAVLAALGWTAVQAAGWIAGG